MDLKWNIPYSGCRFVLRVGRALGLGTRTDLSGAVHRLEQIVTMFPLTGCGPTFGVSRTGEKGQNIF